MFVYVSVRILLSTFVSAKFLCIRLLFVRIRLYSLDDNKVLFPGERGDSHVIGVGRVVVSLTVCKLPILVYLTLGAIFLAIKVSRKQIKNVVLLCWWSRLIRHEI